MTLDTMGPFRKQETNRFIGTYLASYSTMEIWHKIQTPFSWQNCQLEREIKWLTYLELPFNICMQHTGVWLSVISLRKASMSKFCLRQKLFAKNWRLNGTLNIINFPFWYLNKGQLSLNGFNQQIFRKFIFPYIFTQSSFFNGDNYGLKLATRIHCFIRW